MAVDALPKWIIAWHRPGFDLATKATSKKTETKAAHVMARVQTRNLRIDAHCCYAAIVLNSQEMAAIDQMQCQSAAVAAVLVASVWLTRLPAEQAANRVGRHPRDPACPAFFIVVEFHDMKGGQRPRLQSINWTVYASLVD
jgi:hypothetical protein